MQHLLRIGLLLAVSLLVSAQVRAADITVAAAADLKFAMDELVAEFSARNADIQVRVTYGSSGNFYAQIGNRAPFDLFFSADIDYPRKLAAAGHALDAVFAYAVGRIVVWVPVGSPVDVRKLGMQSLLAAPARKIAIANPQHAPYGRAAEAAMKALGVHVQAQPRLVLGDNVAQTAQFVQSGAADIGIIALSLAVAPQLRDSGIWWEVPHDAYPTLEQGGMIVRWTRVPEAARAFRDFVLGSHGRDVLKRHGFSMPEK